MPAKGAEVVDVEVTLKHETQPGKPDQGAYLVYSTCGRIPHEEWIPKSIAEIERKTGAEIVMTLPRAWAEATGLV